MTIDDLVGKYNETASVLDYIYWEGDNITPTTTMMK